ncbi:hypothetical protein NA56DRAFT_708268 [Hyaloscypha hepaticicola]|uniref:Uncharacterized protein n=1 Tax=Hyaloscypha hepaticicola TaxID=2082293 RepID=A0A2J6PSP5_9HELO|nr:hypothetical protein NA56DRAFT_708268 [Hyaloscypha hepaticicola]
MKRPAASRVWNFCGPWTREAEERRRCSGAWRHLQRFEKMAGERVWRIVPPNITSKAKQAAEQVPCGYQTLNNQNSRMITILAQLRLFLLLLAIPLSSANQSCLVPPDVVLCQGPNAAFTTTKPATIPITSQFKRPLFRIHPSLIHIQFPSLG